MLSFETELNFELIGTLIGLAIYNSVLLGLAFPRVVYKKLLDEPVALEDLREFEPALHTTLTNILKGDADAMDLSFVISYDNYGKEETVELIENGASVRVINDNKHDFVDRYVDWFLNKSVNLQFERFHRGFYKVVSKESIRVGFSLMRAFRLRRDYQADQRSGRAELQRAGEDFEIRWVSKD
jgi:hypothetical protein